MQSPNDFKTRFNLKDPNASADLQALLQSRIQEKGQHLDWALLCESLGFASLAAREFQLECRDNPQSPHAKYKISLLHREKGEVDKALSMLEQLLENHPWKVEWVKTAVEIFLDEGSNARATELIQKAQSIGLPISELQKSASPDSPAQDSTDEVLPDLSPADSDCARFHSLFSGRENIHARQWAAKDGEAGYSPIEEPLTPAVIRNHLLGSITVGVYPIRMDGTCTFFALDLDITKAAIEKASGKVDASKVLRAAIRSTVLLLAEKFFALGITPLLEDSGYKGRHLWFFLDQPETAETLHKLGQLLLAWLLPLLPDGLNLEFFPKQASLKGKGLGNLIKLPLGIHRRTGRRAFLLNASGDVLQNPFGFLRTVRKLDRPAIIQLFDFLKSIPVVSPVPISVSDSSTSIVASDQIPLTASPPPSKALVPDWNENDFVLEPRISHLLDRCPVLQSLKDKVDSQRSLSHEEQLVLIHTLGHLDAGPLAVNFLLKKCVDVGPEKLMGDKLKGSPTACANIRKRIPHITRLVQCNCTFELTPERYPTPALHLLSLPVIQNPSFADSDLPALTSRYFDSLANLEKLNHELSLLTNALIQKLLPLPLAKLQLPNGTISVLTNNGVLQLVFTPKNIIDSTP